MHMRLSPLLLCVIAWFMAVPTAAADAIVGFPRPADRRRR